MSDPTHDLDNVLFEFHTIAATVPEATPRQFLAQFFTKKRQACRGPFYGGHQARSVGLARGQESQHERNLDIET
jgi:hypothetical protein